MVWNQLLFEDAVRNKMAVQRQTANADTTRANAAMQGVEQQPNMQAAQDQAAMDRAQVAANNQAMIADMNNQSSQAVADMNTQAQRDIASLQDQGSNYRAGLTTGTQRDIAGLEDRTKREGLAQQNMQFGQTIGLDTGKAQESAIQARALLSTPEYGTPTFNPKTSAMESGIKRPAISGLAPSPLSTLGSGNGLDMESDDTLRKIRAQLAQ
uniref:Uncharacterized protein n=1 Tax=Desulfovibrio sp. U5L TaxID=596152 RepID=I2PZC9_9BACT